jgi:hypothetical protein
MPISPEKRPSKQQLVVALALTGYCIMLLSVRLKRCAPRFSRAILDALI